MSNDTDASLENIKLDDPSEEDLKRSEEKLRQQAAEEERQKEATWQKYVRGTDANGWHMYEDNERGFRISFPPGWDLGFFPPDVSGFRGTNQLTHGWLITVGSIEGETRVLLSGKYEPASDAYTQRTGEFTTYKGYVAFRGKETELATGAIYRTILFIVGDKAIRLSGEEHAVYDINTFFDSFELLK